MTYSSPSVDESRKGSSYRRLTAQASRSIHPKSSTDPIHAP